MKSMRKILAMVLTVMMVMTMATTAFADETGTGTITIKQSANVSVAGKTFNAYKILDLVLVGEGETLGYVYTVPTELAAFYSDRYDIATDAGDFDYQVVQKVADEADMFAFAADALAAAKAAQIAPATATADADAASVALENLPLGYYVIEDEGTATPISALMLDSTDPSVEITIKADKPSIIKKIDGRIDTDELTTGLVDFNNAAIGDKVPYVLTSKVPDMTGYKKYFYVVTDTMSAGLEYNNDMAITVNGTTLNQGTDYTVAATKNGDGTTTIEIIFVNFIRHQAASGKDISYTYTATVDNDAVIGTAGNPNEVVLKYSNNPNLAANPDADNDDKPTADSPVGETPKDVTVTYVTGLVIEKVDPDGNALTGATFTLEGEKLNTVVIRNEVFTEDANGTYWLLNDGTYTTEEPTAETEGYYADTAKKYTKTGETKIEQVAQKVTSVAEVGADGKLVFDGLSAGEYTITEIKAPAGYNLLTTPIDVTVNFTAPQGDPAVDPYDCTWNYTWTNANGEGNTVEIVNRAGMELPSTGGIGTTIFYALGGVLVLAAVVLLVTKKRMDA